MKKEVKTRSIYLRYEKHAFSVLYGIMPSFFFMLQKNKDLEREQKKGETEKKAIKGKC